MPKLEPAIRVGAWAWAILGIIVILWVLWQLAGMFSIVILPALVALFPALILSPVSNFLKKRGAKPALAALVTILGALVVLAGIFTFIGQMVAAQLGDLGEQLAEGYESIRQWLIDSPFNFDPGSPEQLWDSVQDALGANEALAPGAIAFTAIEAVTALLFGLVSLFFYLKDGHRLVGWIPELLPGAWADHADAVGSRVWNSIGGYFRGQLVVAFVDAVFIGLGLVILGVPLALPLAVLVFFGGFFPIVGAFVAGLLAVLVALTEGGIGLALIVVALNVAVQQIEGNVLEPLVVGRATRLHPFVVLVALTGLASVYGLIGAFLAVPIAAAAMRVVEYIREVNADGRRRREEEVEEEQRRGRPRVRAAPPSTGLADLHADEDGEDGEDGEESDERGRDGGNGAVRRAARQRRVKR